MNALEHIKEAAHLLRLADSASERGEERLLRKATVEGLIAIALAITELSPSVSSENIDFAPPLPETLP